MSTEEPTQVPTQVPTITSQVKPKSPGRVAAGKRLAEMSKAARERKKQEQDGGDGEPHESLFTCQNILASLGVGIGAVALFYQLYPKKAEIPPLSGPTTVKITRNELESFD